MRTTLDIAPDILQAVKEISRQKGESAGTVLSNLARVALTRGGESVADSPTTWNGVPVFPARPDEIVTLEHVQALEDEST